MKYIEYKNYFFVGIGGIGMSALAKYLFQNNKTIYGYDRVQSKITDQLLADIEKDTVNFSPNYDGSEQIPDVLPTRVPTLLVNGSSGIAVGMATNIPPHNLTEVINGSLALH